MSRTCDIQQIPTKYAGVLFSSKLEAQWALFFDRTNTPWKYEPNSQGKNLYLPNFRVSILRYWNWVEIKPTAPTPSERRKALAMAQQEQKSCAIFYGHFPLLKESDPRDKNWKLLPQGIRYWPQCEGIHAARPVYLQVFNRTHIDRLFRIVNLVARWQFR